MILGEEESRSRANKQWKEGGTHDNILGRSVPSCLKNYYPYPHDFPYPILKCKTDKLEPTRWTLHVHIRKQDWPGCKTLAHMPVRGRYSSVWQHWEGGRGNTGQDLVCSWCWKTKHYSGKLWRCHIKLLSDMRSQPKGWKLTLTTFIHLTATLE